jgi:molecular chaperone GrpE
MSQHEKKNWGKFKAEHQEAEEAMEADMAEELDAERGALDHPSYASLEDKLTEAEQKAHEYWEKLARATAELDNVRRRADKTISDANRFGLTNFITNLLPVVDSLDQALQMAEKNADAGMQEGLVLTMKQLMDVLEKNGVKQIDPQGQTFDPQQHEAMSMQEVEDGPANMVLTVFQKGYLLHDRVIRPARVIVSKAKS